MPANKLSVDVKSRGGFLAKLPGISSVVAKAVAATALAVETRAKQDAPVDTGRLRSAIAAEYNGTTATVNVNVDYALFVELGTRTQRAQPFLYPAMEAERQLFLQRLKAALQGKI